MRKILVLAEKPVSAMDLVKSLLALDLPVNKTTVYRELEKLLKKGEISEVDFGEGQKRYELTHGSHHHHALCMNCHAVVELEIEPQLDILQNAVARQSGFHIQKHSVEFFGLCRSCQKGS